MINGQVLYLLSCFVCQTGIQPILPIFREAVLNGEPELKEAAANGLSEVIRLTSSDALKPSVVHVTGPLIRILGDRFAWNVKVAVLDTLALLLAKVWCICLLLGMHLIAIFRTVEYEEMRQMQG